MRRTALALPPALLGLLLLASSAMAKENPTGGQGFWGESNDKVITYASFLVIAAVPLFLLAMTLLQSKLERRKAARKAKASQSAAGARGGW